MKIRLFVSRAGFALLAATLISNGLDAQDRTWRARGDDSRAFSNAFTLYNGVLQERSNRARMGVYVDQHQPSRYDELGARLTGVSRNSPAEDAGLEEGDIISSINGQSLTSSLSDEIEDEFDRNESLPAQRLMVIAREMEPGDELDIEYVRDGETESVSFEAEDVSEGLTVYRPGQNGSFGWSSEGEGRGRLELQLQELSQRSEEMGQRAQERAQRALREFQGGVSHRNEGLFWSTESVVESCPSGATNMMTLDHSGCLVGAEIREIEAELGSYFEVDGGLLVMDAAEDNPLGLQAGDVVLKIGDREISSFRRLRRLITSYEVGETITLTVMRSGNEIVLEGTLD